MDIEQERGKIGINLAVFLRVAIEEGMR